MTARPLRGTEVETTLDFLGFLRDEVLRAVDGLTEEQARRRLVPSLTTLGGIVKHLAYVERWWFRAVLAGEDVTFLATREDPGAEWRLADDETLADVVALYRGEIAAADAITRAGDFDDLSRREVGGERVSLRWVVVHMIEETGRHAGHADILREQVDGFRAT